MLYNSTSLYTSSQRHIHWWDLEINQGRSIYTMDIGKGYTNQGWIYCVLIAQV